MGSSYVKRIPNFNAHRMKQHTSKAAIIKAYAAAAKASARGADQCIITACQPPSVHNDTYEVEVKPCGSPAVIRHLQVGDQAHPRAWS